MRERENYRELILENIEYDYLIRNHPLDRDRLDELVELMVDTVCSNREMIRIAGDDYPAEVVKSRFMKLDSSHVQYVMDCMRENTTYVRNIKKYLLAALYNAPGTISNYYSSLVQHDMYGDGQTFSSYLKVNPYSGQLQYFQENPDIRRDTSRRAAQADTAQGQQQEQKKGVKQAV